MADGTICFAADSMQLHQLIAPQRAFFRSPTKGKHFIARSDVLFRMTMAIEAPLHVERRLPPHQRHPIHATVATLARNPFADVDPVMEIDIVRQVVHAGPVKRSAVAITLANGLEHLTVCPQLGVAVHADTRRGNPRKRFRLD